MRYEDNREDIAGIPRSPRFDRRHIHHAAAACVLAHGDRTALIQRLDRPPGGDAWVLAVARAKIGLARVAAASDLPADRIGVGSRFAFTLGAREAETAVLAPWDEDVAPLGRIALRTRLGIALLGMREGAHVDVPRHDGTVERLAIDKVLYRPGEAAGAGISPANDNRWDREARP